MSFASHPRLQLAFLRTPIEALSRLGDKLVATDIFTQGESLGQLNETAPVLASSVVAG